MSTNTKLIKTDNTFLAKLTFVRLCYHYGKKRKKKKVANFQNIMSKIVREFFIFSLHLKIMVSVSCNSTRYAQKKRSIRKKTETQNFSVNATLYISLKGLRKALKL